MSSSSRLGLSPTFKAHSDTNPWVLACSTSCLHPIIQAMECSDQKQDRSLIGSLDEVLDELQGSSYFVKKLSPTNALHMITTTSRNRCGQLSMPRKFISEHGNKFRRAVELRSDLSGNKPWPYFLSFCTSRLFPEVTFAGSRWGAFVTAHGLVQGDQLIFSLTAMSQFQVYVFNALGDPKGPQRLYAPMKWPLRPVDCKTTKVDEFEDAFSIDTPSELQEILSEDLSCLPSFTRRLVAMNNYRLEIPKDFVAAYGDQLRGSTTVQLQGIREDSSAKYDVKCIRYMGSNGHSERMYMRGAGWEDFVSENQLRLQQELVFTLTARSCFVAREVVSWSPHTGLNPGSAVSARRLRALRSRVSSHKSEQGTA